MSEKRVVWTNPDGSVSVLIPAPGVEEAVWRKDIPQGVTAVETTADKLPKDRLFRKAWALEGEHCHEHVEKAKEIAHEIRRAKRAEEFAPHDEVIAKRIPGKVEAEAEAAREAIRAKYAEVQTCIESCSDCDELRRELKALGV